MVAEEVLTREERREQQRQRMIAQALEVGDIQMAAIIERASFDDGSTPEEDAEDARIAAERIARGKFITLEESERMDEEEFPEDVEFFRKLDERFPNGFDHVYKIDPDTPEGAAFFDKLGEDFQDAVNFFLYSWSSDRAPHAFPFAAS